jgi:glucose/arabinose dehydrogenase
MIGGGHTFQELAFNPLTKLNDKDNGMLYLGIGDGGSALSGNSFLCDNPENIWGSVIRIDPDGNNSANGKYGIPEDNPFVNTPNALGEIWAYGFRNPHRISWDETGSGKMFITNIGQHSVEEVNIGKAGANYGWPNREGTFLFDVNANPELVYPLPEDDSNYTYPVIQYDHDEGSAVSGGFVYTGNSIPLLKGKYIFGDISLGTLFYSEVAEMIDGQQAPIYRLNVAINGQLSDMETITNTKRVDLRLGEDSNGELYLLTKGNGVVYKVVDCVSGEPI